nr:putative rna polymerase ii subunit b1 ctd phosphatase rpap2 like [Quercus suber]
MAKDQLVLMKDAIYKLLLFLLEDIQNENQLLAAGSLMTCSEYEDVMTELKIAIHLCGWDIYIAPPVCVDSLAFAKSLQDERCLVLNREKLNELYQKGGQLENSIRILEDYVKGHPNEADTSVIDLLASIFKESNSYDKTLQLIEHAKLVYHSGKELPLNLIIKEGICHVKLKNMEKAEVLFSILLHESVNDHAHLIAEAADSLMSLEHYDSALKYYLMFEGSAKGDNGFLYLKIAQCYLFLKERVQAIFFLYKALQMLEDNIDARLTLASLLLEEAKEEDAISLLAPPKNFDPIELPPEKSKPWWLNEKVKLKLCTIYRAKAMVEDFVDAIFPLVRESLYVETLHLKVVGLDFMDVFTTDLEAVEDCRQLGSEWLVSGDYVIPEEEDGAS